MAIAQGAPMQRPFSVQLSPDQHILWIVDGAAKALFAMAMPDPLTLANLFPAQATLGSCAPATVQVPAPLFVECNSVNGIAAEDPSIKSWREQATASDSCSVATLSSNAPVFFVSGCGAGKTTDVTFTATDNCGNVVSETSSVTIVDTIAPDVNVKTDLTRLWPPNHGMVDVGLSVEISDACTPAADVQLPILVTSSFYCGRRWTNMAWTMPRP